MTAADWNEEQCYQQTATNFLWQPRLHYWASDARTAVIREERKHAFTPQTPSCCLYCKEALTQQQAHKHMQSMQQISFSLKLNICWLLVFWRRLLKRQLKLVLTSYLCLLENAAPAPTLPPFLWCAHTHGRQRGSLNWPRQWTVRKEVAFSGRRHRELANCMPRLCWISQTLPPWMWQQWYYLKWPTSLFLAMSSWWLCFETQRFKIGKGCGLKWFTIEPKPKAQYFRRIWEENHNV